MRGERMKKKIIFILITMALFFSAITFVSASSLVEEKVDGVYYARIGGEEGYYSAPYYKYTIDGLTAYCIEPGTRITSKEYLGREGLINSPYSDNTNRLLQLIGYYGYDYPNHNTDKYRMATQALIWQTINPSFVINFTTERNGQGDKISIDSEKEEIMALVNRHTLLPSFIDGGAKYSTIGDVLEYNDTNDRLKDFYVMDNDGATVELTDNKLVVKDLKARTTIIKFKQKTYTDNKPIIFFDQNEVSQTMAYFGLENPAVFSLILIAEGGSITVQKVDSDSMKFIPKGDASLSGTVFWLYNEKGSFVEELRIGEDGKVTSRNNLNFGRYFVHEQKPGIGYERNYNKYYFDITKEDLYPQITIPNDVIKNKLEITKVLEKNQTGIMTPEENISFQIYLKRTMELVTTITTNSDGYASCTLPYGEYIVRQVNTTPGYEKYDDFEIRIDGTTSEPIKKVIVNESVKVKLKVKKVDAITKKTILLDGIKFKIKNLDTNEYVCQNISYPESKQICEFETQNGIFITPDYLVGGNYQLEELENQIIDGYIWNDKPLTFTINNNNYIQENGENILEIVFENEPVKGEINVKKYGELIKFNKTSFTYYERLQDDIEFSLFAYEDIYTKDGTLKYHKDDLIETLKTVKGKVSFQNLDLGKYYIKETKTKDNYILDPEIYIVELKNQNQYDQNIEVNLTLKNYLQKGKLNFNKIDKETKLPLADVKIEIYDSTNDNLIYKGKTDENGNIVLDNLYLGQFYIIETETQKGYVLNNERINFEIKNNEEVINITMENEKIKGSLKLIKIDKDSKRPISDTLIQVYNAKDTLIYEGYTNKNGIININNIEYGKYYIIEKKAHEGYVLNTTKISFEIKNNNEVVNVTMDNEKIKGSLKLIKVDKDSKEPISGTLIQIFNSKDELVFEGSTDKKGIINVAKLEYGKYYIIEKKAHEGYVLNNEKIYFEIKKNKEVINITMNNEKIKGSLKLVKIDKDTKKPISDTLIQIFNNNDKLIYEGYTDSDGVINVDNLEYGKYYIIEKKAHEGYVLNTTKISFEIKNNNEVVSVTMDNEKIKGSLKLVKVDKDSKEFISDTLIQVFNEKDELIYEGYTDSDGAINVDNLEYGKYYIIEKEAHEGYVLNDEKIYFEIKNNQEVINITMNNEKIKGSLKIIKVDKDSKEPISDTLIQVFNEKDELVYEEYTDSNGNINVDNLEYGKYYIMEKEAHKDYVLNDEKIYFEIKNNQEVINITMDNEKIKGSLYFIKRDKETNEAISNTLIQIFNIKDELIYEGYTNEFGEIIVEDLNVGQYYIIEKEAHEGYILYNGKLYFEIKNNNENIQLEMFNEKIPEVLEEFIIPKTEANITYYFLLINLISFLILLIYDKKIKY